MRPLKTLLLLSFMLIFSVAGAQKAWQTVGKQSFSDSTRYQSLAFPPSSQTPYVAYKNSANGRGVTVKKFKGSQWVTVGSEGFSDGAAVHPRLAFPPTSDTPYVAYSDEANGGGTTVKKFDGSQWVTVGTNSFSDGDAFSQDLAFPSSSDTPYVVYSDQANGNGTTVKKFDGTQWVTVGTDSFSDGGAGYLKIAISGFSDNPYVAYSDYAINNIPMTVQKFNGTQWVTVGTDSFSDRRIIYKSIAFPPASDTPYVAYPDGDKGGRMIVKKFDGSQWVTVGTDSLTDGGSAYPSVAFPPFSDTPYVAYSDGTNGGGTTVKKFNGNRWVTVGTESFSDGTDYFQNLAFPPSSNMPFVAFQDRDHGYGTTVMKYDTCSSPTASFSVTIDTLAVNFTDQSSYADSWKWHFGDDDTSTQQHPSHTYQSEGTYQVCLEVTNVCGNTDSSCQQVTVEGTGILSQKQSEPAITVYPNPASQITTFQYKLSQSTHVELTVNNLRGKVIKTVTHKRQSPGIHHRQVDLSEANPGVYFYQLQTKEGVQTGKLVVTE